MPTKDQLRTIHQGARVLGLIEGANKTRYQMLLRNVAGKESALDLDNRGVEDVMAVMEDMGFDGHPRGKTYWRDKVRQRGHACGERMVQKILDLARQQRYDLEALCRRFSDDRADNPADLKPAEAWRLIEMLKAAVEREQERNPDGATTAPPA